MTTLELKRKVGKQWVEVPVEELVGLSFGEMFGKWEGEDVVALVHHGADKPGVVAGTQKWVDFYVARGYKAMLFSKLLAKLDALAAYDVLSTIPIPSDLFHALAGAGFGGGTARSVAWPREIGPSANVA